MRQFRLWCPSLTEGEVTLSAEESHHAVASLRLGQGQHVTLFDGAGREATGEIIEADRRHVRVLASPATFRSLDAARPITLAVAMPRTHRQGYLIEKCTELAAAAIWPMLTERGVAKPTIDAKLKWTRRAIEAAKQSSRAWVPDIHSPQSFATVLGRVDGFAAAWLLDTSADSLPLLRALAEVPKSKSVLVLIGPEGGWSDKERSAAVEAGAVAVTLGSSILRTETAAVAVCAAAMLSVPG